MAASQTIRTLKLALLADVSKFGPELKKGESDFERFQASVSRAAVPAAAALTAIGTAAFSAINAAADLEQTFGAVEQVFGQRGAQRLAEFAEEAAKALGQSRQEALGAAQNFGILGRAAGLRGDDLVDFSTTLSVLASDLAAFANTTPQDAIEALGSALRGEFNPIERFGVVLNAAAIEAIALENGLIKAGEQLTAQEQIYARYLGLLEQTQTQSGQFAREQESIGSQTAIAKAELENFRVQIGEELLPVFVEFIPFLQDMVASFVALDPEQITATATAIAAVAVAIVSINTALKVFATLSAAWAALMTPLGAIGAVALGAAGSAPTDPIRRLELDSGFTRQQAERYVAGLDPYTGAPRSGTQNRTVTNPGGLTAQNVINITGFVGSPAELARAIDRAMEQAARQGQVRKP